MNVKDEYRTNPLSLRPGGYTVKVEYRSGQILYYDKVKNPTAYIERAYLNPDVKKATVEK